ncbi:MAG: DUF6657 family protein [Sphaerochaetaceae bacterium]
MALLKSAWEIVMDRTENIQADPEKIHKEDLRKDGRRLAGSYLLGVDGNEQEVQRTYAACAPQDKPLMREGIATTIILNIALPQDAEYTARFERMLSLSTLISGDSEGPMQMLGQIRQFFDQYLGARDSLMERMKQQYQGVFAEKQERIAQKYGKGINASIEQDPEYLQLVQRGYTQLSTQYQQVLDQAKNNLKQMWGLA